MIREFEGKNEQEAIAKAMEELQVELDEFDIEVVEGSKRGLFKKGNVRIRVRLEDENSDYEEKIITFVETLLEKMGYPSTVKVNYRDNAKLGLEIVSDDSAIIIGRKGKNLDAIQLLVNVYGGQLNMGTKIVVDSENYRLRHEENLVKLAFSSAEQVKRSGRSRLLEPMNPFERRLVHTALNTMEGVTTKSEGEGLYKQVRISIDDELPPLRKK
ncbi:MAG: RNA-binding cell elongation regulator Jag/EloR [Sphaerochaetaceae bacterium]|jgi:spoIIIJ-associated protein|nr:protein jag [Sphaerochaetaceae bacterium]